MAPAAVAALQRAQVPAPVVGSATTGSRVDSARPPRPADGVRDSTRAACSAGTSEPHSPASRNEQPPAGSQTAP
ncbi:unannotated protein [freshwater metagenome]|uniref:Unannotated protein n=1 Tax=freshwater metagenome TaxID=449393 RepID=A0A6J7IIR9_9ZZZZ